MKIRKNGNRVFPRHCFPIQDLKNWLDGSRSFFGTRLFRIGLHNCWANEQCNKKQWCVIVRNSCHHPLRHWPPTIQGGESQVHRNLKWNLIIYHCGSWYFNFNYWSMNSPSGTGSRKQIGFWVGGGGVCRSIFNDHFESGINRKLRTNLIQNSLVDSNVHFPKIEMFFIFTMFRVSGNIKDPP